MAWGIGTAVVGNMVVSFFDTNTLPTTIQLPMFVLSPQEIFENKIPLLDVNFFNPSTNTLVNTNPNGSTAEQVSAAATLQPIISQWYNALRNLAIVALLSILVYIAIRIIVSSSAEDRAKYKQRIMDWLVAMCLLFFMHYIMAFAVTVTEEVTKAVQTLDDEYSIAIGDTGQIEPASGDKRQLSDYVYENGDGVFDLADGTMGKTLYDQGIIIQAVDENENPIDGQYYINWPTNLMGKARVELQVEQAGLAYTDMVARQFGYTIVYLALVIYTILFLFRYLKRMMMLAFLTMIAPLMAMTYPLDKMRDGSAQGFNTWFREYMFNLLIQPVHLILYTVLIGSAMDLVAENLVYALVALGFILEAEKILRKFFGFDKATTLDSGSALGGALAMQGIHQVSKILGGKKGDRKNNDNKKLPNRKADKGRNPNDLLSQNNGQPALSRQNPKEEEKSKKKEKVKDVLSNINSGTQIIGQKVGDIARTVAAQSLDLVDEFGNQIVREPTEEMPIEPEQGELEDTRGIFQYGADRMKNKIDARTGFFTRREQERAKREQEKQIREQEAEQEKVQQQERRKQFLERHPWARAGLNTGKNISKNAKTIGAGVKYVAPKAGRMIAKGLVKTTLAGAGATIGLTAGLVSDSLGNVPKWTAQGAGAGLLTGIGASQIPNGVSEIGDKITQTKEEIYAATHSEEEIEARLNEQADIEWRRNKEIIKKYADKLEISQREAREIMEKIAQKYREYGITDDDIIIKAIKAPAESFGADKASKQRISLAKMATEVSGDKKQLEQVEKGLKRRGVPQAEVDKYVNKIRDFNKWT